MSFAESNGAHAPMQNLGSSAASDSDVVPYYPIMPPMSSSPPPTETYHVPDAGVSVPLAVSVDPSLAPAVNPVGMEATSIEPAKRKRGRPRKYAPDGSANSGMISPPSLSAAQAAAQSAGGFSPPEGIEAASFVPKKGRGRPPGSGRKQQSADLGSPGAGIGFKPHVFTINAGEDVMAKLMSFSQSISRSICLLSANGSISNVTIQQAAISGGTVAYEGHFEILSLSGHFILSESGGERSMTGRLKAALAGADGHILGGGVVGVLTAASAVQVVIGSFAMQQAQKQSKLDHSDAFGAPSGLVSGASAAKSSSSLGTVSESSGEPMSPHNQLGETSNNSPPVVANNMAWR